MSDLNMLFGIPFYKTKIDESQYNKKEILDNIEKNYNLDPHRNNWQVNTLYTDSDLHHMYNDKNNNNFIQVDVSQLTNLYNEKIIDFFDNFMQEKYEFTWNLVNYTCMKKNQFMNKHSHPNYDFVGIHYIKFNEQHSPTVYYNPAIWIDYKDFLPFFTLVNKTHNQLINSYLHKAIESSVMENDFVITPGMLSHSVPKSQIDDLRVTIVIHINIKR